MEEIGEREEDTVTSKVNIAPMPANVIHVMKYFPMQSSTDVQKAKLLAKPDRKIQTPENADTSSYIK